MEQIDSLETKKRYKKTEAGEIPVDWEVARIGDICEILGGSTPSTSVKKYWNGDIPWAVPTDITNLQGNVISETEKKITKEGLKNCAAKILPAGSILITSLATIGKCAINLVPMATNQGFINLICKENVYNWYLFYIVSYFQKELERLGAGRTLKEIPKKNIRVMKIPLPPLPEQKKIAEILTVVDEIIEKSNKITNESKELKKGLMQVLLMGKKRV